jgi:hypothetical protein
MGYFGVNIPKRDMRRVFLEVVLLGALGLYQVDKYCNIAVAGSQNSPAAVTAQDDDGPRMVAYKQQVQSEVAGRMQAHHQRMNAKVAGRQGTTNRRSKLE